MAASRRRLGLLGGAGADENSSSSDSDFCDRLSPVRSYRVKSLKLTSTNGGKPSRTGTPTKGETSAERNPETSKPTRNVTSEVSKFWEASIVAAEPSARKAESPQHVPTSSLNLQEEYCPICRQDLADLPDLFAKEQHLNQCLDRRLPEPAASPASKKADTSPCACGICGKDLGMLELEARQRHVNYCIDHPPPLTETHASTQQTQPDPKAPDILPVLPSMDTFMQDVVEFPCCPCCSLPWEDLEVSSVPQDRFRHIQICAHTRDMHVEQVIQTSRSAARTREAGTLLPSYAIRTQPPLVSKPRKPSIPSSAPNGTLRPLKRSTNVPRPTRVVQTTLVAKPMTASQEKDDFQATPPIPKLPRVLEEKEEEVKVPVKLSKQRRKRKAKNAEEDEATQLALALSKSLLAEPLKRKRKRNTNETRVLAVEEVRVHTLTRLHALLGNAGGSEDEEEKDSEQTVNPKPSPLKRTAREPLRCTRESFWKISQSSLGKHDTTITYESAIMFNILSKVERTAREVVDRVEAATGGACPAPDRKTVLLARTDEFLQEMLQVCREYFCFVDELFPEKVILEEAVEPDQGDIEEEKENRRSTCTVEHASFCMDLDEDTPPLVSMSQIGHNGEAMIQLSQSQSQSQTDDGGTQHPTWGAPDDSFCTMMERERQLLLDAEED